MNRRSVFAAACLTLVLAAAPFVGGRFAWSAGHDEKPATTIAKGGTICAVTGEEIPDAKTAGGGKAVYNGKTYYFCCAGCAPQFKKTPAKFAQVTDLRLEKITLAARLKAIDAQLTKLEKAAAKPAPSAQVAPVKAAALHCAITDEEIPSAKDAAGSAEVNGKTYYFCCGGCVAKFKADPTKFAAEADARELARK